MRIAVVSAHFPPNFVSGGTLQPQWIARGLRACGHEVSVYAGWLGAEREPLEGWDEADETGLPVRWVVTTPWTGWNDDKNWDNPAVAADFGEFVARFRPDIVHFHSLQSLGAGLVSVAAAGGARVALTMHDFWWLCGRQFLVEPDLRPCCLVVDAGICGCEVDRAWLDRRTRRLREVLADVDLVLAPSASAARVLEANGIDPDKLVVDENGLPSTAGAMTARPLTAHPGAVRFLYVGGSDELKGVKQLFAAARRLADDDGWWLIARDAKRYVDEAGISLDGMPIEMAPGFTPAQADEVYSGADVVIVPSVMRESFSIVTREALGRGLPVICSDSLGPEEVVEHARNGLVVPAGDDAALARAMSRVIHEPGLLAKLKAGCGRTAPRTVDDQVAGLDERFSALLAGAHNVPDTTIRRVLFVCGIDGAPLRYRAHLPAEAIGLLGVQSDVVHYRATGLNDLADSADVVVMYRVPATVQILAFIQRIRAQRTPVFFDVDDLIFDPDIADEIPALTLLPPDEADLWLQGVRRYRTTMEACDGYIGSTAPLCRHATEVTGLPAERFDNGVGVLLARASDAALRRPRRAGPLRVGYLSGTDTHDNDWLSVESAIVDAVARHPDTELWLVGRINPSQEAIKRLGQRIVRVPPVRWFDLPGVLRDLDVNLCPLAAGSRFNESKSAIKWLEAALTETPSIVSPTEPFQEVVRDGVNGLVAHESQDWGKSLERLLADEELRERLGRSARREVLLNWSPHLQGRRYLAALDRLRHSQRRATSAGWVPEALDEPATGETLEPYQMADDVTASSRRRHGRRRSRGAAALVGVTFLLLWVLLGTWAVATPLFGAPDEPTHIVRAASVVRGQILGPSVPSAPGVPKGLTRVRVPGIYDQMAPKTDCWAFHPEVTPSCVGAFTGTSRTIDTRTYVGRYNPVYYAIVGAPSLVSSGARGVYAMRLLGAGLAAGLVALAIVASRRARRPSVMLLGVALALTPMACFLAGTVNPSGMEIAAAVLAWVAALLLFDPRTRGRATSLAVFGACALLVSRGLSPLWVGVILVLTVLAAVPGRGESLLRDKSLRIPAVTVAVVGAAAGAWIVGARALTVFPIGPPLKGSLPSIAIAALGNTEHFLKEMVGVLQWLDTPVPLVTLAVWLVGIAVLATLALASSGRRMQLAIVGCIGLTLLSPLLELPNARTYGLIWQGRYSLPLFVGIPILAAYALSNASEAIVELVRRVAAGLSVAVAFALVGAFYWAGRRNGVGTTGPVFFLRNPDWSPPIPFVLLLMVNASCVGALLVMYQRLLRRE